MDLNRTWKLCGLLAAPVAVAVVLGCGCGEAGSRAASTSAQVKAPPRMVAPARFIEQAKAICQRGNEERGKQGSALLERRAEESGESLGLVGELEQVRKVVAPSLAKEIDRLERIGLPKEQAYEAEALWQTLRIVLQEVEVEGIYAWRSAKLLRPFHNRARPFGLENCVSN